MMIPEQIRQMVRLSNIRRLSQSVFFLLFILALWASGSSRLGGFPVSRFLELDPLVAISTFLSTGYVYRFLGWSLLIIVITFLFGRVFCNWFCPFGSLSQFIGWLFNIRGKKHNIDDNRYRRWYNLKYYILIVMLVWSFFAVLQIGLLDPIVWMYRAFASGFSLLVNAGVDSVQVALGHLGFNPDLSVLRLAQTSDERFFIDSFWILLFFITLMALNVFLPRFFCRALCPLGALLGFLSRFSLWRINRDVNKCTDCNLCLLRCEGACDPQSQIRVNECFACMNCIDDCPEDALSFKGIGQDSLQVIQGPKLNRRRAFFTVLLAMLSAFFLRKNSRNTDQKFSPWLIRPPGSNEESLFLAKCIKCDQCLNVCPTNVLQLAPLAVADLTGLWTPVMDFDVGHCQLKCNLCSEVCPTGAIRKITVAEKLGKGDYQQAGPIRLGTAFFDRGRCLPHAMEIPCVVCEEVCPVSPKAIQTRDEEIIDAFGKITVLHKPFVIPDLCIGCGICQSECPIKDSRAVYVTAVGESRSPKRQMLLENRTL